MDTNLSNRPYTMHVAKKQRPDPTTPLGITLQGLMDEARLNPTVLARLAGVNRQTIYNMLNGIDPSTGTLGLITKGLASDPKTGAIDAVAQRRAWDMLAAVLGAPPPVTAAPTGDPSADDVLVDRLRQTFEPGEASVIADWLEETADYTPEDKRFTVHVVEWLRRVMQQADAHRNSGPMQLSSILQSQR